MVLYDSIGECDSRTSEFLEPVLMADESFVLGTVATDGLLERWSTRLVVTDRRVLFLRRILLEKNVRGAKHDWIDRVEISTGAPDRVRVETSTWTKEADLESAGDAEAVVETIRKYL